jgi:hypothetical protein
MSLLHYSSSLWLIINKINYLQWDLGIDKR